MEVFTVTVELIAVVEVSVVVEVVVIVVVGVVARRVVGTCE